MAQRQWRSDDTDSWVYGFGDGSDGDYSSSGNATDAPIDSSCSGTSGTNSLSATNASFATGQLILIHQTRGTGAGGWELNKIAGYTAGTITTTHALTMTYTDSGASQAQVLVLKQYSSFTQNSGHTLTAKAWDGNVGGIVAFLCSGDTTITGGILGTGKGHRGGAGGSRGNPGTNGQCGEGSSGAVATQNTANGSGGGGGGPYIVSVDHATGGAGGANGANGSAGHNNSQQPGNPGDASSAVGVAGLTSIHVGGGGGGGGGGKNTGVGTAGSGGIGGAITFIFSKELTISGSITLSGTNGGPAVDGNDNISGGGGGGAGGSCLLKAETATLGTTKIVAAAGSGGADGDNGSGGGNGAVGRIHLDYSVSYTGTTTPTIDVTNDVTIVPASSATGNFFMVF